MNGIDQKNETSSHWQQLDLFDASKIAAPTSDDAAARARETAQRRLSYARVTRDPAVALSSAANQSRAAELGESFAAFVAGLSDERRAEIRRRLGLPEQAGSTLPKRARAGQAA